MPSSVLNSLQTLPSELYLTRYSFTQDFESFEPWVAKPLISFSSPESKHRIVLAIPLLYTYPQVVPIPPYPHPHPLYTYLLNKLGGLTDCITFASIRSTGLTVRFWLCLVQDQPAIRLMLCKLYSLQSFLEIIHCHNLVFSLRSLKREMKPRSFDYSS